MTIQKHRSNGNLMQHDSIAESSYMSFLQYYQASLSSHLSLYLYYSSYKCPVFKGYTISPDEDILKHA